MGCCFRGTGRCVLQWCSRDMWCTAGRGSFKCGSYCSPPKKAPTEGCQQRRWQSICIVKPQQDSFKWLLRTVSRFLWVSRGKVMFWCTETDGAWKTCLLEATLNDLAL